MATKISSVLGVNVIYNNGSPEVYRGFGFSEADDLGNIFQFKRDFNDDFNNARSQYLSLELNPKLQSFDKWLSVNPSSIPIS